MYDFAFSILMYVWNWLMPPNWFGSVALCVYHCRTTETDRTTNWNWQKLFVVVDLCIQRALLKLLDWHQSTLSTMLVKIDDNSIQGCSLLCVCVCVLGTFSLSDAQSAESAENDGWKVGAKTYKIHISIAYRQRHVYEIVHSIQSHDRRSPEQMKHLFTDR